MSITTPGKVRDIMGTDEEIAIMDEQLIALIGVTEKIVRRDVFQYKESITPSGNPQTGVTWNGSNTSFNLGESVMDYDFDESTTDDVSGTWIDSTYAPQTLSIVVSNARYGRLTIKQADTITALPASAISVSVDYYTNDEQIPFPVLEDMGTYLCAHLCQLRMTEPRKVSLIDLESNKRFLNLTNTEFYKQYNKLVNEYQLPELRASG
jgi:hypothetical protein